MFTKENMSAAHLRMKELEKSMKASETLCRLQLDLSSCDCNFVVY